MRSPISFNTSFLISSWVSVACHGAVIVAGVWLHTDSVPQTPPKPVLDHGENAVTVVWRSLVPRTQLPEVEIPVPAPSEEDVPPAEPEQERQPEPEREPEPAIEIEATPEKPPPQEPPPEEPRVEPALSPLTPRLARVSDVAQRATVARSTEARDLPMNALPSAAVNALPALLVVVKDEPPSEENPGVRDEARLATRLAPHYPRSCRRRGHQGTVRLECRLNVAGTVVSVRVVSSSGCDTLDRAALEAIRPARFDPARVDGEPVAGTIVLPVEFRLR